MGTFYNTGKVRVCDVWVCVLPDNGSLAMQRMLGRGMTINCCKVSCSGEEEVGCIVGVCVCVYIHTSQFKRHVGLWSNQVETQYQLSPQLHGCTESLEVVTIPADTVTLTQV